MSTHPANHDRPLLAAWATITLALFGVATLGPRLWAGQTSATATIAGQVVAVGELIALAIFLPLVMSASWRARVLIVASVPILVAIASRFVANESLPVAVERMGRTAIVLVAISTFWAFVAHGPLSRRIAHVVVLLAILGMPALAFLGRDFGDGAGWLSHVSPLHVATSTFSHGSASAR